MVINAKLIKIRIVYISCAVVFLTLLRKINHLNYL